MRQATAGDGRDGRLGRRAPQVVHDDVDAVRSRGLGQGGRVAGTAEGDRGRRGKLVQHGPVAARGDHPARAQPPGQRHRDPPGCPGRAQHQHGLTRPQRGPPGQRQPGTHPRVDDRRGGHLVQALGQRQRKPRRGPLRHRPVRRADTTEIHRPAVRQPARAVDPGDHRQRALAAHRWPASARSGATRPRSPPPGSPRRQPPGQRRRRTAGPAPANRSPPPSSPAPPAASTRPNRIGRRVPPDLQAGAGL